MIKVNKKMLNKFLQIMDDYGEFVFGDEKQLQNQLQVCLNSQGYWSGTYYRIFYDENTKEFYLKSKY